MKLVGAVATLVLLGVPWVFSAFGAIDNTTDQSLVILEGIFQVNILPAWKINTKTEDW